MPLRTAPLALIVTFGVLLTIATHAGVFGIPTLAIVGSWFFKYGFAVLDDVIEGRGEPPVLSLEFANPFEQRPLGLFFLLICFYSLTAALKPFLGEMVVGGIRISLLAMVPAMVAAMSIAGRFLDALNPVTVVGMIVHIPFAYAALLLTLGCLWFVAMAMLQASDYSLAGLWRMESFMPGQTALALGLRGSVQGILGLMLFMYLWLAMFSCIGGTVYEHRKRLGLSVAISPERTAARVDAQLQRERDQIMDRIYAQIRGGALNNAADAMLGLISTSADPIETCRWTYERAAQFADQRLADYVAQLAVPKLLDTRATGDALKMVRERLQHNAEFRPRTSSELLRLARLAREGGDRVVARQLLAHFPRHFPDDPMQPVVLKLQADWGHRSTLSAE